MLPNSRTGSSKIGSRLLWVAGLRRASHRRRRTNALLAVERMEERALLSTIQVTSTSDRAFAADGVLTLRDAILLADGNLTVGQLSAAQQALVAGTPSQTGVTDTIDFAIPGTGVQTIQPLTALPTVTHPVLIDGYSQPGSSPNTLAIGDNAVLTIELDGTLASPAAGLAITAGNTTVRGLVIDDFSTSVATLGTGVYFSTNGGDALQGCYIGTNASGSVAQGNFIGVYLASVGSITIGGSAPSDRNVISGNSSSGLVMSSASNNVVEGNYFGTDASGETALGNHGSAIFVAGQNNRIGTDGSGPADETERNVISGSGAAGIEIDGATTSGNVIAGNYIGTDATGTVALSNAYVDINLNANGNFIGTEGTTGPIGPDTRNVISGHGVAGVAIAGSGNLIAGNYIGTDATGTVPLGNAYGVFLTGSGNVIGTNGEGGNAAAEGNLISGNLYADIHALGASANTVAGNSIGTDVTGEKSLGDGGGVYFGSSDHNVVDENVISGFATGSSITFDGSASVDNVVAGNFIGTDPTGAQRPGLGDVNGVVIENAASSNQIGGTGSGQGNTIAYSNTGVLVQATSTGNSILGNSIHDNAALGIDLGGDGVTPNTPSGPDNFPVLSAAYAGSASTIVGTFNGTPNAAYRLEFFSNPAPGPSGYGQGQIYLGFLNVTTDGSGNASFTASGLAATSPGQWLSATATGPGGSTSEFAQDVKVSPAPTTTTLIASAATPLLGDAVTFTATVGAALTGAGSPTGSVQFAVDGNPVGAPVPLSGGVASYTTSSLGVGGHSVTAAYGGDGTFQTSLGTTTVNVLLPASLSGVVFADFNDDGQVDFGEQGIPNVPITLTGTDDLGHAVSLSQTTDSAGTYVFLNLRPGTYTITKTQQPAGYTEGINSVGTGGGSVSGDQFTVSLTAGQNAMNYNYGEIPAATGPIQKGQTAGIGFWNNTKGQALIKALNGGVGTQLGDWLAATFPHMFGALSGSNSLAGQSNAYVASFFQGRFVVHGQKLDAQVLATALAVYVTDPTLDSTGVGAQYGFTVGGNGVATATVNVGSNGAAFGVADNIVMTVMDLLLAADSQAVNGLLYNGDAAKRDKANTVFSALNQAGGL
jgi:hypothetical protein